MNKFCLVTSLFNVNREKMSGNDGRTWSDYLKWFSKTLQIKTPMIIFCEEELVSFIEEHRKYPTKIVTHSVSELPYLFLKEDIEKVLTSNEYAQKISDPMRPECQDPMYTVVQYSKFKWLRTATELNPFDSEYFFWIDAGACRHFDDFDPDLNEKFPSEESLQKLDEIGDRFVVQLNMDSYPSLANSETLTKEYFWDCRSITCGSFFGGNISSIERVEEEVGNVWVNDMIKNGLVNNEQIVLAYLIKNKPELFSTYERYNSKHMDIFSQFY